MKEIKTKSIIEDNMTTEQIADYYEVGKEAINSIIKRNKKELELSGTIVLIRTKLKDFKYKVKNESLKYVSSLTLFNYKSILLVAFYLQNNNIANKVKAEILKEDPKLYKYYEDLTLSIGYKKRYENGFKEILYPLLNNYHNIKEQVKCEKYLIDFVIDDYIAIEVDEDGHNSYNIIKEIKREKCIKNSGYKLFRFNPHEDNCLEFIGEIINELITSI